MEIKQLKMSEVVENPDNPRRQLGDLESLAGSINALGLIEPIVVRQLASGQYIIVSGARRYAACKKLKYAATDTIPCIVRDSEMINEALASIAENTAREDLSVEELSAAVDRLEGLAMSDDEIAGALAISVTDVGSARLVAKAPKKAKALLDKPRLTSRQFTLEESALLVKYAGDDSRAQDLVETIEFERDQLPHVIARFEAEDAESQFLADLRAPVEGLKEIAPFQSWQRPQDGAEPLHNLANGNGQKMTEARHKGCPNAAFLIEMPQRWESKKPRLVHYCADWEASGHKLLDAPKQPWPTKSGSSPAVSDTQREADAAARKIVIANNKLWRPACTVRENWIEQFTLRKELNQAAKQWVLSEILLDHTHLVKPPFTGTVQGFEQSFVIVWSQLVAAREGLLIAATWRPGHYLAPLFDRYFRMLKAQGYPVSEVESLLIIDPKQGTDAA